MYYIIKKIEAVGLNIVHYPVSYTSDEGIAKLADTSETYYSWINENQDKLTSGLLMLADYFNSNPPCYDSAWNTESISGFNLKECTDPSNPEVV